MFPTIFDLVEHFHIKLINPLRAKWFRFSDSTATDIVRTYYIKIYKHICMPLCMYISQSEHMLRAVSAKVEGLSWWQEAHFPIELNRQEFIFYFILYTGI